MEKTKSNLEAATNFSLKGKGLMVLKKENRPNEFVFGSINAVLFFLRENFEFLYELDHEIKCHDFFHDAPVITLKELEKAGYLVRLWNKDKNNAKYRFK